MHIHVLTIFPEAIQEYIKIGIVGRAIKKGLLQVSPVNIRDFAEDEYKTTDDYPYGGGKGMIMKVEPLWRALESIPEKGKTILLTPQGNVLTQERLREYASLKNLILIAGRYKGVDERIRRFVDEEVSIGDYILSGGELPALVVIEGVARLIPGAVSASESVDTDSFERGMLDAPYYTRPAEFKGMKVPDVLLSGNHKKIEEWRKKEALKRTLERRPELLEGAHLTPDERRILDEIIKNKGEG